jgi:hypothetical protein
LKIQNSVGVSGVTQFLKQIPEAQRKEVRNALGTEIVGDEQSNSFPGEKSPHKEPDKGDVSSSLGV